MDTELVMPIWINYNQSNRTVIHDNQEESEFFNFYHDCERNKQRIKITNCTRYDFANRQGKIMFVTLLRKIAKYAQIYMK